ncbi:hypothetical protein TNCV_2795351 [Trichonephila clavipes]|nr:hypothetical protein TNCV_2795351 [Trichonephila clavipes]
METMFFRLVRLPALPEHILDCPRLLKQDLYDDTLKFFQRIGLPRHMSELQIPGWARLIQPFSGLINEYQACFGTEHWSFSHQTDHLTVTSTHAPQRLRSRKLR